MSDLKLGELITGPAHRDAIHVAVAPVTAVVKLYPGQRVALVAGKTDEITVSGETIGIVDPFLIGPVCPDEKCWLFLFPNTVTGMRHHWRHPAFRHVEFEESHLGDSSLDMDAERLFVESVAEACGKSFDALIDDALDFADHGEYAFDNSEKYKEVSSEDWARFWRYFTADTGKEVKDPWAPYTCSC